jgi:hypothetical protein
LNIAIPQFIEGFDDIANFAAVCCDKTLDKALDKMPAKTLAKTLAMPRVTGAAGRARSLGVAL